LQISFRGQQVDEAEPGIDFSPLRFFFSLGLRASRGLLMMITPA